MPRFRQAFLTGLFGVHMIAGLFAVGMDLVFPFSQSAAVARFIETRGLRELRIVGDRDTPTSAVAAFLDRPMYYPASRRLGTFIVWDRERRAGRVSREELLGAVAARMATAHQSVLVVLTYRLTPPPEGWALLGHFEPSIVGSEQFYVYLVREGEREADLPLSPGRQGLQGERSVEVRLDVGGEHALDALAVVGSGANPSHGLSRALYRAPPPAA